MSTIKLLSELKSVYNVVNTLPRFCAELVFAKTPHLAAFNGSPQLMLTANEYTKLPRSTGNVYSNSRMGFSWNEDNITSFKFPHRRAAFGVLTVQLQNTAATDANVYVRVRLNEGNQRLIRVKVPANDEEAATISFGYDIASDNVLEFDVMSTTNSVRLSRYNLILILTPNDQVSYAEMV